MATVLSSPNWRARGWTWDVDGRLSLGWRPRGEADLAGAQLRAGAMLRLDPSFVTFGVLGRMTWDGVPGIGLEVESLSTLAGAWAATGATLTGGHVHWHGTAGWAVFAVEVHRAWEPARPDWQALLALRLPLGWLAQAVGLRPDGVPGQADATR